MSRDFEVEEVDSTIHRQMLAGQLVDWKSGGIGWQAKSLPPFVPSTFNHLITENPWAGELVPSELVGMVWTAASTEERGSKRWKHCWHVFECGEQMVLRLHRYDFDKG